MKTLCVVGVTILVVASPALLGQASPEDRFVGTWVEDQSKRSDGSLRDLTFRSGADGGIEELRGSYANPLVQPVRLGAAAYPVAGSQNMLTWKQLGPRHFERTTAQRGSVIMTRQIQISDDGKTLTETTAVPRMRGGVASTTIVYQRASSEADGLVGVWKAQSRRSDHAETLLIEATGRHSRVTENPDLVSSTSYTLTFDGTQSEVTGATVINGSTVSSRRVSDREIQLSPARLGVPTGTVTLTLSPDGTVLTYQGIGAGPRASSEPTVRVLRRRKRT